MRKARRHAGSAGVVLWFERGVVVGVGGIPQAWEGFADEGVLFSPFVRGTGLASAGGVLDFRAVFLIEIRSARRRFQSLCSILLLWIRDAKWAMWVLVVAVPMHVSGTEEVDADRLKPVPADQPIPVSDFFRYGRIQEPRLNDSGSHIAAIISDGQDKQMLMIREVKSWEPDILEGDDNKDVYSFSWLTDDRLMFNLSQDKRWADSMLVAKIGRKVDVYSIYRRGATHIIGIPEDDPLRPIVWVRGGTMAREDLGAVVLNAKLNVDRGNPFGGRSGLGSEFEHALYINEKHIDKLHPKVDSTWGQITGFQSDRKGELAYAYTINDGLAKLHQLQGKTWIPSPVDLEAYNVHRVADKPGYLLVTEAITTGEPGKLYELDAATGELGEMIFQDPDYGFAGRIYRDRKTDTVVGVIYDRAGPNSVWFDKSYESLQLSLNSFFPKKVVRLIDSNEAATVFVVQVYSDREPTSYHLVDLGNKKITLIGESRPWLDPQRMQPMNIIQFKTTDGEKLDAYVTMPAGASKENPPPLIVMPHGGPWARDHWGFSPSVQFLASRGYAVLQPNYRGSTGSGWKFSVEDQWDFVKMHEDVSEATRTLVRSGYADPERIAIMGGSFGGYLALMGAVHEPDLYRCAISFAGVFDWEESVEMASRNKNENAEYQIFLRHLGDPEEEAEKYDRFSPGRRVDQITMPVFVAHGKDDNVVNVGESKRLIRDLKKYGIEHESMLISGEGHGTQNLENSVELYERIEAFLAKHL